MQILKLSICTFLWSQDNENRTGPSAHGILPEISFAIKMIYIQDVSRSINVPVERKRLIAIGF